METKTIILIWAIATFALFAVTCITAIHYIRKLDRTIHFTKKKPSNKTFWFSFKRKEANEIPLFKQSSEIYNPNDKDFQV